MQDLFASDYYLFDSALKNDNCKMVSVQERLKLKRVQIDTWSVREQLCLASAVLRSGDQNWMSVSRSLKTFDDAGRPSDWFSQKSCAVQYSNLLENVETPKRKKRADKGEASLETPSESIARRLTEERIEELKKLLNEDKVAYSRLKDDVLKVKTGVADDKLGEIWQEIEDEKRQIIKKNEAHERWLKEREEKKIELERAWKPLVGVSSPHKRKHHQRIHRRTSSHSEHSSEAECALDSPLSEPLNVDVIGEENIHEAAVETKPTQTPTSPLLTSLLKSPSPAPTSQGSSILHSAITSHRGASPTISSLLSTAPGVPGNGNVSVAPPTTVSSSLKNLVSSAISAEQQHHQLPPHNPSPAAGAPTLSMLLELPPSLPGKPLPELPSVVKTTTTTTTISPSTVSAMVSAASPLACSSEKLIPLRAITTTTPSGVNVAHVEQSTLSGEGVVVSTLPQEFKISDSTSKADVEVVTVDSTQNTVDTNLLVNANKEELIEEVLIEEVVVNEDSLITTELLSTQITEVMVATDEEGIKIAKRNCKKQVSKLPQYIEVSQSTGVFPSPKDETKSKAIEVDSTANNATLVVNEEIPNVEIKNKKEHCVSAIIETTSQELVTDIVNEEETSLGIVPESEVELSSESVAEVIEITDDQETTIHTEVVGECESIQALANMEVIILDKMQELSEVEIVEDMKELGCEVVEVVMEDQEKVEDVKEDTEESNPDEIQSEITCIDSCTIIPKSSMETLDLKNHSKFSHSYDVHGSSSEKDSEEVSLDITSKDDRVLNVPKTFVSGDSSENVQEICDDINLKEIIREDVGTKKNENQFQTFEESFKKCREESSSLSPTKEHIRTKDVQDDNSDNVLNVNILKETQNDSLNNLQEATRKPDKCMRSLVIDESVTKSAGDLIEISRKNNEYISHKICNVYKANFKTVDSVNMDIIKCVKEPLSSRIGNVCKLFKSVDYRDKSSEKDQLPKETVSEVAIRQEKSTEIKESKEQLGYIDTMKQEVPESSNQASSKEEKSFSRDVSRRELPQVLESNNKIVREHIKNEGKQSFKDTFKKEVLTRENVNDTYTKEVRKVASPIDSVKKEDNLDELGNTNTPKEIIKKENLTVKRDFATCKSDVLSLKKEHLIIEASKDAGKQELSRRFTKDDALIKETIKHTSSQDDKKEPIKDDVKNKLLKEFAKSQRKPTCNLKDSEISVPVILRTENEILKNVPTMNETCIDFYQKSEGNKNKQEQLSHKEGKNVDSNVRSLLENDNISSIIQKEEKEHNKECDLKLDPIDSTDEKSDRRILFRAETPSTEDDKTNDAEPQKSLGRKRLTAVCAMDSVPNSPSSTTDEEREYKSWKKSIMLLYGRLATHKFASLFLRPITDDQAPGYSTIVHRPIDLLTIKKNIETGVIRTTLEFQRDVMLMFLNSIMYNKSSHFVHKMALQMQSEGMQHIQDFLTTQMLVQVAGEGVPIRRETRTTEANKQREMLTNPSASVSQDDGEINLLNLPSKRKRITGSESERSIKKKRIDE